MDDFQQIWEALDECEQEMNVNRSPTLINKNILKCAKYLSDLIHLTIDLKPHLAINVIKLIQDLVDGVIQVDDFHSQIHRLLNVTPHPMLLPFLKKSVPYMRYSLMMRELAVDGIRPPAYGTVPLPLLSPTSN